MTFDSSLNEFLTDTVTIEPYTSETAARVPTYGTAVTYSCYIERGARRVINQQGKDVISNVQVTIPNRVFVDTRSRLTLPTGFVPQTPQILGVTHLKGLGLDHTVVMA